MSLLDELESLEKEAQEALAGAASEAGLEELRQHYLGRRSRVAAVAAAMRDAPAEERPALGKRLNQVRGAMEGAIASRQQALFAERDAAAAAAVDVTLPGRVRAAGALHPLTLMLDQVVRILRGMGFALAEGPEVETEFHCFDALNTPPDHPARNESDTFYFASGRLLRTHTSTVQIRAMEAAPPPLRVIAPGSAYRRDEIDATHLSMFHQIEGLYVAEDVSLADLKGTLEGLFHELFGPETRVRFRPHFFPFTEPSFEIDIELALRGRAARWIEVAGCGMVDPGVFEAVNRSRGDAAYDPERTRGFAFGFGLERLAMIRWGISDIRLLIENDERFLGQFSGRVW